MNLMIGPFYVDMKWQIQKYILRNLLKEFYDQYSLIIK